MDSRNSSGISGGRPAAAEVAYGPGAMGTESNPKCSQSTISARLRADTARTSGMANGTVEEIDVGDIIRANLARICAERSLSLGKLAELSSVNLSALEDVAVGRSFPSVGLLWKLARVLELPCTVFIETHRVETAPAADVGLDG